MSKFIVKVQHKPTLGSEGEMNRLAMRTKLNALPVEWRRIKLTDHYYFTLTWEDWAKVIEYLKPKVPKYYRDKFDCENFAGWFKHKVAEEFGINTMAEVEGYANARGRGMERHGWNIFTDGKHWYQLETQTGVIMDIDDPDYVPDEIVVG